MIASGFPHKAGRRQFVPEVYADTILTDLHISTLPEQTFSKLLFRTDGNWLGEIEMADSGASAILGVIVGVLIIVGALFIFGFPGSEGDQGASGDGPDIAVEVPAPTGG
jgi:hypothetical protein